MASASKPEALPQRIGTPPTVIVLTLALIARLLPFFSLIRHSAATWIYGRGLETGFVAHALLTDRGFASPFGGDTGPTALISPGYTLLVAAVFHLFGDASTSSAIVVLLAQIVLGILTVWLTMLLAARLAGPTAAVLAGCFFALWPPLLWVPTIFWDTSLTLCLMPALLLLALRLHERSTLRRWLVFGALCGFSILINLALSLTVLAVFLWAVWNTQTSRRYALLAATLALLIYTPWPLRNARVFHAFIPLRTTVGLELWMGNRQGANGFVDESVFPLYNRTELASYQQFGEVKYMQEKSATARAYIRLHPFAFAALSIRRFLRFWFGRGTRGGPALYAVGATFTTVFGLLGLWRLFQCSDRAVRSTALLYILPLLLFPLPYYITHAEFRYRLVIDPLLTALAASFTAARIAASQTAPIRRQQAVEAVVLHA